jgi:outer membrane protein assembly factor BamB
MGPAPPYREVWRFPAPEGTLSGAAIVGSIAIAVGAHAVYGIDVARGNEVWHLYRNGGPISMPAVGTAGGRRILVFLDQSEGTGASMVGVDLATRLERWRVPLGSGAPSGVAIADGTAYGADTQGAVYAVDLAKGRLLWTVTATGRIEGPVAVADGAVYVVSRDPDARTVGLMALDAGTGERRWGPFSPPVGAATATIPAAGDGLVVMGSADRVVRGFAATDGAVRWTSPALSLFSPVSGAALGPWALYVADASGGVYRIDPRSGGRAWDHQLNELIVRSSPVVAGGAVLIGLNDGRLVALDTASGSLVWQSPVSVGLIGAISVAPDLVVAVKGGPEAGLVAFAHDPNGHLVDVPSPTVVDAARLAGNFGLAFLACLLVLLVPLRFVRARIGPAFAEGGGDLDHDEGDEP